MKKFIKDWFSFGQSDLFGDIFRMTLPVGFLLAIVFHSCAQIEQRIYKTLLTEGVDSISAKIITAQAAFESGFFKNELTLKHNNVFALLHNPYRQTYSFGGKGRAEHDKRSGYAQFKSIEEATKDFVLFLKYRKLGTKFANCDIYAWLLKKKRYYGSPWEHYARGLRYCHRKLFK